MDWAEVPGRANELSGLEIGDGQTEIHAARDTVVEHGLILGGYEAALSRRPGEQRAAAVAVDAVARLARQ